MRIFHRRHPFQPAKADAEKARRELNRVRAQWPLVLRYAAAFEDHARRNHLSESISKIYRGGHA